MFFETLLRGVSAFGSSYLHFPKHESAIACRRIEEYMSCENENMHVNRNVAVLCLLCVLMQLPHE